MASPKGKAPGLSEEEEARAEELKKCASELGSLPSDEKITHRQKRILECIFQMRRLIKLSSKVITFPPLLLPFSSFLFSS